MSDPIVFLSRWMRGHLHEIALAIVATLLMIFGSAIVRALKPHLRKLPMLVRILAFMLVCSFGFAMLCTAGTRMIASLLGGFSNSALSLVVVGLFLLVGSIAQSEKFL